MHLCLFIYTQYSFVHDKIVYIHEHIHRHIHGNSIIPYHRATYIYMNINKLFFYHMCSKFYHTETIAYLNTDT